VDAKNTAVIYRLCSRNVLKVACQRIWEGKRRGGRRGCEC